MNGVWIVDDDQSIRWVLERALLREGFAVRAFECADDCLAALASDEPRVLVSDIRMPGTDGITMLQSVKTAHPRLPVIIMTAFSDLDSAVSAFQSGAFEYLAKPFDLSNAIELIRRAVDERGRAAPVPQVAQPDIGILGQAPAMQEVFRAIGRLSQSPVTVLITGESGTGKELVAQALHQHSARASKPFVALNTAAIPRDLLESELFGHERGAFTGAQQQRRGRFEQAEGGTLFLDEIGDMPAELQTRLLRVLSDGQFYRVGGTQSVQANVRVIAATHQALEERVRDGRFREDLFHRLNVIRLRLPPLRERREDIPLLAQHFLAGCAREMGGEPRRLSESALEALCEFPWPGNVRQLENVCRWLTVMAPAQMVGPHDLPPEIRLRVPGAPAATATPAVSSPPDRSASPAQPSSLVTTPANGLSRPTTSASVSSGAAGASVDNWLPGLAGSARVAGVEGAAGEGSSPAQLPARVGQSAPFSVGASRAEAVMAGDETEGWIELLALRVAQSLREQPADWDRDTQSNLMDTLTRRFEAAIITTALRHTRGRRIDAAARLGIGRNTITRKIQELGLDE